jgi:predicted small metal-binding protein
MKEFKCGDLVPGCDFVIEGESDDQILEEVAVHVREEHGMDEVPPEVQDTIRASLAQQQA